MARVPTPRPSLDDPKQSSRARYAANRKNAQKSTGPKTARGKLASAANGFKKKHRDSALVIEKPETVQPIADLLDLFILPRNGWEKMLRDQLAVTLARINRSEVNERRVFEVASTRAHEFWDRDRAFEASKVGANLRRDPDKVVQTLLQTPQGCDWLLARWGRVEIKVKSAVESDRPVPEETVLLASNLMGYVRGEELEEPELKVPGFIGQQVERLKKTRLTLVDDDRRRRSLVMAGQDERSLKGLSALRNQEHALKKHYRWLVHLSERNMPDGKPLHEDRAQFHREVDDPEQYNPKGFVPYSINGMIDRSFNPDWLAAEQESAERLAEREANERFDRSEPGRALLRSYKLDAQAITARQERGIELTADELFRLRVAIRQMDQAPEDVRADLDLDWLDLDEAGDVSPTFPILPGVNPADVIPFEPRPPIAFEGEEYDEEDEAEEEIDFGPALSIVEPPRPHEPNADWPALDSPQVVSQARPRLIAGPHEPNHVEPRTNPSSGPAS